MTKLPHNIVEERNCHGCSHRYLIRQYSASLRAVLHRTLDGYLPDADGRLGARSETTYNNRGVRAAGAVGSKHVSSFHRFFSQGSWLMDEVGFVLAELVMKHLVPTGGIRLVVDDTLGRHTGKRIAAASMHRDPLLSTGRRVSFSWGHVWVVLSVEVTLFDKSWALPVLFRLHRSEKRCKK